MYKNQQHEFPDSPLKRRAKEKIARSVTCPATGNAGTNIEAPHAAALAVRRGSPALALEALRAEQLVAAQFVTSLHALHPEAVQNAAAPARAQAPEPGTGADDERGEVADEQGQDGENVRIRRAHQIEEALAAHKRSAKERAEGSAYGSGESTAIRKAAEADNSVEAEAEPSRAGRGGRVRRTPAVRVAQPAASRENLKNEQELQLMRKNTSPYRNSANQSFASVVLNLSIHCRTKDRHPTPSRQSPNRFLIHSRHNSRDVTHANSKDLSFNYDLRQLTQEVQNPPSTYQQQYTPTAPLTRNNFQLQYVIGIGGFGRVWKVTYKQRVYAMKEMSKALVLFKKSVHSVLNELKLLTVFHHPFLVNVHVAFQDHANLYLVLDFLEGGDLRYHLGRKRRFTEAQTKFFVACILVGLDHLHSNHIIHRDIKPENLVLDSNGYVRITDLGVARYVTPDNAADTSGTPGYMAPEVMCRMNHSYPVDFYALGVICYEFIYGVRPYNGASRKEIRDQILAKQVLIKNKPDTWSYEGIDFINRLLQRKPQNRLTDCKNHPWLKHFPWDKLLRRELAAPFIPNQKDNFDQLQIQYEDEENQQIILKNAQLVKENQEIFGDYSYEKPIRRPSMRRSNH